VVWWCGGVVWCDGVVVWWCGGVVVCCVCCVCFVLCVCVRRVVFVVLCGSRGGRVSTPAPSSGSSDLEPVRQGLATVRTIVQAMGWQRVPEASDEKLVRVCGLQGFLGLCFGGFLSPPPASLKPAPTGPVLPAHPVGMGGLLAARVVDP
jgi:hypothetical protein